MVDRHVALAAPGLIIPRKRTDRLEQRRLPVPFSPTMIVMGVVNSSSKSPLRKSGMFQG
jgi:hypothetical protein